MKSKIRALCGILLCFCMVLQSPLLMLAADDTIMHVPKTNETETKRDGETNEETISEKVPENNTENTVEEDSTQNEEDTVSRIEYEKILQELSKTAVGVGLDEVVEPKGNQVSTFAFGDTSINTYNEGGNNLSDIIGVSREQVLSWLGHHVNDTYYLTTPYGDGDFRNPNGDCSGAYGADDTPGNAAMNCTGFIWHTLMAAGGNGGIIPGIQGWASLLRNNSIEYRTYEGTNINNILDTIVRDDGYIEPGDIIWTWDADAIPPGLTDGLANGLSDHHHIGIYTGTFFDSKEHNYNYNKTIGDVNGWWHSIDIGGIGNNISNILPKGRCGAVTVIKLKGNVPQEKGSVKLLKKSSNPSLTNGNSCYSLNGAEYGVYSNASCTAKVGTLVTDESGATAPLELNVGEYWVKELTAPKGFALDTNPPYKVTITAGSTETLNVVDNPQSDPISILLGKIDAETNQDKPQGSASLKNAEFTIKYFSGMYDKNPEEQGVSATRKWVLKTGANGKSGLGDEFKVSGDDFYYMSNGVVTLPLGTITIQETKPPVGYLINNEVFIRQITSDGTLEGVNTYNEPEIPETPQKGIINLQKVDKETGGAAQGTASLAGAVYEVFSSSKNLVDTLTTNADGKASSKELPFGVYSIKEKKAPAGFLIDTQEYSVELSPDNNTDRIFYRDVKSAEVPQKIKISIEKVDGETNKNEPQGAASLAGATYEIRNSKNESVGTVTTDKNGKVTYEKELPLDTYTVREKTPPEGYLSDPTVHTIKGEAQDTTTRVFEYKAISPEQIIRGDVEIIKLAENQDPDNDTPVGLAGVEFTFISKTSNKEIIKIITDKNGFATTASKAHPKGTLVYDTYIVTETKWPEGFKPIEPFEVTIKEEGVTLKGIYKEDKLIVSPVTVVKKDKGTGLVIPVKNIEFRLLDSEKKPIIMTTYYPNKEVHETFKTDENGQFTFPDKLQYGTYYLEELNAPQGYLKGELLKFTVTEGSTWEKPLMIEYFDENVLGKIRITKTDEETKKVLAGAKFEIQAAEDITTPDGTLRLQKGEVAETVTTKADGTAESKALYLGKYLVKETQQPDGFLLNPKECEAELKYKDQVTEIVYDNVEVSNVPTHIKVLKLDSKTKKPIAGVTFAVWNKEMVSGPDAEGMKKETYTTDKDGVIELKYLAPGTYCFQEVKTLPGYVLNEKIFSMVIDKDGRINGEDVGILEIENTLTELIGTKAKDQDTNRQEAVAKKQTTFVDTVEFKSLQISAEYTIKGILMDKGTGRPLLVEGKKVTAEKKFTPKETNGSVDVIFTFDASGLKGKTIVVFEKVFVEGKEILAHEDIEDQGQTVEFPEGKIQTTAKDKDTENQESIPKKQTTFIDTVKYTNLIVGQEYTLKGTLMDKATGKPLLVNGKNVTTEKKITPKEKNGTVDLEFVFDASGLKGHALVVFEKVYFKDVEVAAHKDIEDKGQTVEFPEGKIQTTAKDKETGTKEVVAKKNAVIVDTVAYENLIVGQTYKLKGVLMDKETGKPVLINNKEITAEKEFVPKEKKGTVDIEFSFNASDLKNRKLVVFEKAYVKDVEIAAHEDINDEGQTVEVKLGKLSVNMPGNSNSGLWTSIKTGDRSALLPVLIAFVVSLSAVLGIGLYRKGARRKNEED